MSPTIDQLLQTLPQRGEVRWIGLRPARRTPIESVKRVQASLIKGLVGDHYSSRAGGDRQVTLIQWEHLAAIAGCLSLPAIDPAVLRRNIAVSGLNLLALKAKQFTVGGATLEHTGVCAPCSFMEEALGPGGYNAVRGHGGICARVVKDGEIRVGSAVAIQRRHD